MPKYQCPECEAVLKRDTAIEEGKKIKCPKCEVIFKAKPIRDSEEEKAKANLAEKKSPEKKSAGTDDDDEIGGSYGVVEDKPETEEEARKKAVHFGSIRDKYPKSKRGPAMAKTVQPSTFILAAGALLAVASVVFLCWALWPFIFSESPPKGKQATNRILLILLAVFLFMYGGLICHGASKMHTLESYNWAMAGSIMSTVLLIGILGIVILKDEEVIAGFEETAEKKDDY